MKGKGRGAQRRAGEHRGGQRSDGGGQGREGEHGK